MYLNPLLFEYVTHVQLSHEGPCNMLRRGAEHKERDVSFIYVKQVRQSYQPECNVGQKRRSRRSFCNTVSAMFVLQMRINVRRWDTGSIC